MDVPHAQRVARPTWINVRTVLGLLLFTLAFLAGLRVLQAADSTVPVWAAARDLAPHTTLVAGDVEMVHVGLSGDVLSRYATGADPVGAVLTRPVRSGELIPAGAMAEARSATAGRSMTIPVSPEHANGGRLQPGDRIDVVATFHAGDARARSVMLLPAAEVLDVVTAGGLVVNEQSTVGVTVAVSPEDAIRVAYAVRSAAIDVAKVTGEIGTGDPASVTIGDFDE
jgi:Flp pilus assembly protein CpaB